LPRETAVAAMTSEMVNPTVAISSIVAARRRDAVFSFRGGAKPGTPVNSAMAVVLANHCSVVTRSPRIGAAPLKNKGELVSFG
jgi:hypothetical protein